MAELYPVIPGTVVEEGNCYTGPSATFFFTDPNCSLAVGDPVTVLWKEGDFYYVKYEVDNNSYRRTYFEAACIEIPYGMAVTTHTPTAVPNCFRYVVESVDVYNSPETPSSSNPSVGTLDIGGLDTRETVRVIGATINGFTLVEYDITGNEDGKRKRGWVLSSKLGAMPNPTGTVYVNSDDYLGAGQSESVKKAMQDSNAQFIYNYLTAYGFTPQAACGVLGNIMKECTMNPAKWQGVPNSAANLTKGYGLFQWTPATNYLRRAVNLGMINYQTIAAMDTYADTAGNEKALALSQLEYMLAGCFAKFQWYKPAAADKHAPYEFTIQEYMASTLDAGTLAIVFHDHFERSGDYDDVYWTDNSADYNPDSAANLSKRRDYANGFYADLAQA